MFCHSHVVLNFIIFFFFVLLCFISRAKMRVKLDQESRGSKETRIPVPLLWGFP